MNNSIVGFSSLVVVISFSTFYSEIDSFYINQEKDRKLHSSKTEQNNQDPLKIFYVQNSKIVPSIKQEESPSIKPSTDFLLKLLSPFLENEGKIRTKNSASSANNIDCNSSMKGNYEDSLFHPLNVNLNYNRNKGNNESVEEEFEFEFEYGSYSSGNKGSAGDNNVKNDNNSDSDDDQNQGEEPDDKRIGEKYQDAKAENKGNESNRIIANE